jgi:hypothetical protein
MWRILLTILMLAYTVSDADARRRHRHHRTIVKRVMLLPPAIDRADTQAPQRAGRATAADLVPPGWQLQPPDANRKGHRYLSPDGSATLALYASRSNQEPISKHMQTVAFAEGEEITSLRGTRNLIEVSGLKDGQIFYRKAVLACGGTMWRHLAWQYSVAARSTVDPQVARASRSLEALAEEDCAESAFSR